LENRHPVSATEVVRYGATDRSNTDLLVVEEPLEIRLEFGPAHDRQQRNIAVTMRTPGNDLELAAGFLFTEGILQSVNDIHKIDWCSNVQSPEEYGNVVKVELRPDIAPELARMDRNFFMNSSCGVCGKASIEALQIGGCPIIADSGIRFSADLIRGLPAIAERSQTVFKHTGGIHAASIFDGTGNLLVQREDVGRHNAVDKAIGTLWLTERVPLTDHVLLVSGRAGFELVQKAIFAGFAMMVAIGAPSSLAVELARQHGLTLVGFLRGERFNVYGGAFRVKSPK
jgi:FdhD protein